MKILKLKIKSGYRDNAIIEQMRKMYPWVYIGKKILNNIKFNMDPLILNNNDKISCQLI